MQAFFLHSGDKSTGTGVFLPQTQYNNTSHSSRRPPCSPVLLPSRVVQALNLNVHQLGLHISPRRDTKNNSTSARDGEWSSFDNKNETLPDVVSLRTIEAKEDAGLSEFQSEAAVLNGGHFMSSFPNEMSKKMTVKKKKKPRQQKR
ncbi:SecY protein transport family protein [Hibiscus syriacus]|uniref:SecY protein transport family protein n=1 Tax=Hibiscus syriacus TaxID=106335 RepID=A0A6A3CG01_HIBSY|nr:SecY protein transport family protein [Hibiscus syriacus]